VGTELAQPGRDLSLDQRKLLDPNDFADSAAVARALNDFEHRYNEIAQPFD